MRRKIPLLEPPQALKINRVTTPLWAHCRKCKFEWAAMYLAQDACTVLKTLTSLKCPYCGCRVLEQILIAPAEKKIRDVPIGRGSRTPKKTTEERPPEDQQPQRCPIKAVAQLEPLMVGTSEAARLLGVSRTYVYKLLGTRELVGARVGGRRLLSMTEFRSFADRMTDAKRVVK
jgi:excisionase family DNA binding protein